MTTDTNNFANSVFPSTMKMASELIADGTDRDKILNLIYNCYRENRIRLMGYMQCSEMKILTEGVAYMVLTKEIQEKFGYREGETEGLVNVPLSIGTVRMSILATEKDGLFRVSVRSKKGTSAQNLAVQFFRGGGHENAAGGKILIGEDVPSPADVPTYIENSVKTFFAL
jgi:phosphoesterase RecJ-like protein